MFLGTLMVLVRAVPSMRDTHTQNTCIYSLTHTHTAWCRNGHSAYTWRISRSLNPPLSDSKQSPRPTVAMETLAATGPSYGCSRLISLWYTVVIPAKYQGRQTAVIHCCKSHKGSCHTSEAIYKPWGSVSHGNVCLAVKTLTLRQAM